MPATYAASSWTADDGSRHELEYAENGMFVATVLPSGTPEAAVIICPSVLEDFERNLRREVLLARRLARHGLATQRFHYRGTGNSFGSEDATFSDLVDDARAARELLDRRCGQLPTAFVGSRGSSLVAAAATGDDESTPLALWDPVPDAATYVREARRGLQAMAVIDAARLPTPTEQIPPFLSHEHLQRLFAAPDTVSLVSLLRRNRGPVLVGKLAPSSPWAAADRAVAALEGHMPVVNVESFPEEGLWWLKWEFRQLPNDFADWRVLDRTVMWLREHLSGESR